MKLEADFNAIEYLIKSVHLLISTFLQKQIIFNFLINTAGKHDIPLYSWWHFLCDADTEKIINLVKA